MQIQRATVGDSGGRQHLGTLQSLFRTISSGLGHGTGGSADVPASAANSRLTRGDPASKA